MCNGLDESKPEERLGVFQGLNLEEQRDRALERSVGSGRTGTACCERMELGGDDWAEAWLHLLLEFEECDQANTPGQEVRLSLQIKKTKL